MIKRFLGGQSLIGTAIIGTATVIAALFSSWAMGSGKIEAVNTDLAGKMSVTDQRVAKLEEAITTIKSDNSEIKQDIKELLKRGTK